MTVTEREEDGEKVSDATIEQIKKDEEDGEKVSDGTIEQIKNEEEEEDTEKVSNATIKQIKKEEEEDTEKASNATIEQIKKEEEELGQIKKEEEEEEETEEIDLDFDLDLLSNVPDGFKKLMKALRKVFHEQSDSSTKEKEESEAKTRKRARIAESEEAKTAQLRIGSGPVVDPLDITLEIVSKCRDFLDYIIEMLKEKRKDGGKTLMQGWRNALERGKHLAESLKPRMKRLPEEMERMKNDQIWQKEYSFRKPYIEDILVHLGHLVSHLDTTNFVSVGSGLDYVKHELRWCLEELERVKEELSELMEVITELKDINTEEDEEEYMRREEMWMRMNDSQE